METGVPYRVQKYNQTNPTCNQLLLISDLFQYFHTVSPRNQLFRFPSQISVRISDPNFNPTHLDLYTLTTLILYSSKKNKMILVKHVTKSNYLET